MNKYFIKTIDGTLEPCTLEEFRKTLEKLWKEAEPKNKEKWNNATIIYGTAGELPDKRLESIFYCPNNED